MLTITKDGVKYEFDTDQQMYTFIHYYIQPDQAEPSRENNSEMTCERMGCYEKIATQAISIARLTQENSDLKKKLEEAKDLNKRYAGAVKNGGAVEHRGSVWVPEPRNF